MISLSNEGSIVLLIFISNWIKMVGEIVWVNSIYKQKNEILVIKKIIKKLQSKNEFTLVFYCSLKHFFI